MKTVSIVVLGVVLLGSPANSQIPDSVRCRVELWDTIGHAFVAPGQAGGLNLDNIVVVVQDNLCQPIENASVQIDLSDCSNLYLCNPDGLTGTTDEEGVAILDVSVGGCDECTVHVLANDVIIRAYEWVVSTDWSGVACDGAVAGSDFAFFVKTFKVTQNRCADYDGDGFVGPEDFSIFVRSFKAGDSCPP